MQSRFQGRKNVKHCLISWKRFIPIQKTTGRNEKTFSNESCRLNQLAVYNNRDSGTVVSLCLKLWWLARFC